jgi:hypothetical protein
VQQYSTNLGLSLAPEFDQLKDPMIWADNLRLRNALNALQSSLDTYTGALSVDPNYQSQTTPDQSIRVGNISRIYTPAVVALTYGQIVHLTAAGAVLANATTAATYAHGFVSSIAPVAIAGIVEITLLGNINIAGLTEGRVMYLSTTDGTISFTAPGAVGTIVQQLGFGTSPTTLWFNPVLNYIVN